MSHPNRRSDDPDDGRPHRLLNAVESTQAKVFARFVWPLLIGALAFFLVRMLDRIEQTQGEQSTAIAQIQSDVRNVNTRLDEGVIRNVNDNTRRIEKLESRVDIIERTVKTP